MDIKTVLIAVVTAVVASVVTFFVVQNPDVVDNVVNRNNKDKVKAEESIPNPTTSSLVTNVVQGTTVSVLTDCNANRMGNVDVRIVDVSSVSNVVTTDADGVFSFVGVGGVYQISMPEYPNLNSVQFVVVAGETVNLPAYQIDPVNQVWCR